nr:DUF6056 family protein [Neobacillus sp. Marseille-Q6967]
MSKRVNIPLLFCVYMILFLFHLRISLVNGSDDTWFADASNQAPFLEWIQMRYTTWSGRLFPDTMLYTLLDEYLWVWKVLNPLFIVLLSIGLVSIIKKEVTRSDFIVGILVLGYISSKILNPGFFWITGSINYLWPIAFGVIAMIPFANRIFQYNHSFSIYKWIVFYVFGIIASISNEQVGLCLSAFSFISVFIVYLRDRTIDKNLFIFTIIIIIGSCILLFAPGNKVRWLSEVKTWFPDYQELTFKSKILLGTKWIYKQLFYEMRNIILLLSAIIFYVFSKGNEKRHTLFTIFSVMFFITISTILLDKHFLFNFDLINGYSITQNLFHFWKSDLGFTLSILPYIFWTVFGVLLVYLLLSVTKYKIRCFLWLAASICTMAVMFFSPTIYASGPRTLVVGSVLIAMLCLSLIHEFKLLENRLSLIFFGCLPFLNLLQLYIRW